MTAVPLRFPPEDDLPPALLVSPRAPDTRVLETALVECGIPTGVVPDETDLANRIKDISCLVMTQEAFTPGVREAIGRVLDDQPAWSELPVVVILDYRMPDPGWREFVLSRWKRAKITFLVRPLTGLELQSAVQLAISARMRQYRIRDQFLQERELRRELNHRVKNIFATVQAVATMTRRTAQGDEAFAQFEERLSALGRVHGTLERVANGKETFETLTRTVLEPYLAEGGRFTILGPEAELEVSTCNVFGLCLFELATNAMKHGALSAEDGHVRIELTRTGDRAVFRWVETGGPPVSEPTRKGYGTRFLKMTLTSLFGEAPVLDYAPDGFRLTVDGIPSGLFL